jgi:lipopolysaccharide transport protein LptA
MEDEAEWSDIQALADDAEVVPMPSAIESRIVPEVGAAIPESEFSGFIQRLAAIKSAERQPGETLLLGKELVFDHAQRMVQLGEDVRVIDDRGELETAALIARFSVSNEVEHIEAQDGVVIRSEGRTATAEDAVYDFKGGFVQLNGQASVTDGGNRLFGERITLKIKGDRKMICEPNALLEIRGVSGLEMKGVAEGIGATEVRADRLVLFEKEAMAELDGNVRLRDPRGAINCRKIRIFLKDDDEIDWIEALFEVIIQSQDRKALAERATYHADEGKFTLEGEPKVKQGQHVMTGDRIIYWHETRRMVCEPNARVLLHVDEETRAKFLKDLND